MIKDLIAYEEYLLKEHSKHSLQNESLAQTYFDKAFDCTLLIDLFNEMKLSTNDWHNIKTLVKEYRSIKLNGTN